MSKCLLDAASSALRVSLEALCSNMLGMRAIADDLNKLVRRTAWLQFGSECLYCNERVLAVLLHAKLVCCAVLRSLPLTHPAPPLTYGT